MTFLKSLMIAATGMKAQSGRMRIIAENVANADSTSKNSDGEPYRRKIVDMESKFDRELRATTVKLGRIRDDQSDFNTRYEPGHPAANNKGYVKLPNVDSLVEIVDMREAQRSYQANLNVVQSARQMVSRTIDILRG